MKRIAKTPKQNFASPAVIVAMTALRSTLDWMKPRAALHALPERSRDPPMNLQPQGFLYRGRDGKLFYVLGILIWCGGVLPRGGKVFCPI